MSAAEVETSSQTQSQDETKKHEFFRIVREFVPDLMTTFPELKEDVDQGVFDILSDNVDTEHAQRVLEHATARLPPCFFDILYQNEELFTDGEKDTEFLPGIKMSTLWKDDVTDKTKDIIWKYLQLMMFSVVNDLEDSSAFGDAGSLFSAIDEGAFRKKLADTMSSMEDFFTDMSFGSADASGEGIDMSAAFANMKGNLPSVDDMHNHINGMLGGKLGTLAKEIAEEAANDLGIDIDDENADPSVIFKKLFRNPQKLMTLIDRIGKKLKKKVADGTINQSELVEEAMGMMDKMKDMPGMKEMLSKMGGLGGGKMNIGAMKNALKQTAASGKTRERLQAKLKARREAASSAGGAGAVSKENIVFSTGEEVQRSSKTDNPNKKKGRRGKKKNKNKKST